MDDLLPRQGESLADLRARIRLLEQKGWLGAGHPVLPFGVPEIDRRLPADGLALGALHEMAPGGAELTHAAAAGLFAAGILARLEGPVLWCLRGRRGVFAPALAGVGLAHERVLYAEAANGDGDVLAILEEGLAHRGLAGVVGEVKRLSLTASRRLQLAAERSGVTAFVLRRHAADDANEATAAATRWRLASLPASPLPAAGVGRPRWRVDLVRCRNGEPAQWIVEACNATGHLRLSADVADGQAAAGLARRAAAG